MASSRATSMAVVPEVSCEADSVTTIQHEKSQVDAVTDIPNKNLYPEDHEVEFLALVDSSNVDPDNGKIRNSLFLYQKIRKVKVDGIRLIFSIGRTLYRIKSDSAISANEFVGKDFSSMGLKAFIPDTFIYSYGVIHGIPLDLSDEYISNTAISDVNIVSVKCFR